MKRSKKQRVSWPPGPKLCQVKMFRTEDCPAKVATQLPNQSSGKPRAPDLPPGFEGSHYADKPNVLNIPRIKWKRPPPKFVVKDTWLIGDGGESTERRTENLRISKVLEAIYPHRSAIPSRPSVSPVVEAECYDDSKTPTIRLTPIEDEWESPKESPHTAQKPNFTTNKQDQLKIKLPCSTEEPVPGLAPDMSLVASAAMAAFMKTKEQGSMVDPDLLIKFLSDPKMIKNLISDKTGISSETKTQSTIDTNINQTRPVPQHVTSSPMATMPQPLITPREHKPLSNPEQRRVSPPKPGYVNVTPPNQISRSPLNIPMPVNPCVSIAAKQPSLPARLPSSSLPTNLNLQRPRHSFPEPMVIVRPPHQQHPNVQASNGFGIGPQTRFDTYPMNLNRADATGIPRPVVQPVKKSLDYFKNLIKEHGTDNHETNQNHLQNGILSGHDNVKVKKKCIYFNSPRGCKLGESCTFVHCDQFRPSFEGDAPMAKRVKYGRYEKNNGFMKTTF